MEELVFCHQLYGNTNAEDINSVASLTGVLGQTEHADSGDTVRVLEGGVEMGLQAD